MYKNTLCGLSHVFFGVANYWGQDNIYPFWGFWELIYTYKHTIYTIWVTLQPVQVSMTCKLLQKAFPEGIGPSGLIGVVEKASVRPVECTCSIGIICVHIILSNKWS